MCLRASAHGCSASVYAHPASERSVWEVKIKSAPKDGEKKLVADNSH